MSESVKRKKRYPVAFCPGPCKRAVMYSDNPNDRKTCVTAKAPEDGSGRQQYCPKCHIYYKILDLPDDEPGMSAVPIISFDRQF